MKKIYLLLKCFCLFIAILLVIPGCASKMSLEEAKKVSMEMSGISSFKPPPRRINDILSVLQNEGQFDKRITDRFQQALKKQPPKTDDDATLARFYSERRLASIGSGLLCEALSDLRKTFSHAEKTGFVSDQLLSTLGNIERYCGSVTRGIELLERAAKNGHIGSANLLTWAYLAVGDIKSAIRARIGLSNLARQD